MIEVIKKKKPGATTIWEDWAGPNSDNGKGGGIASLNHYSKGAVCEWIFSQMCGIEIGLDNQITIAPNPGGHFDFARLEYDSIYGTIVCGWKKNADGTYEYEIVAPPNAKVTLGGGAIGSLNSF